jgi:hypothetical protein
MRGNLRALRLQGAMSIPVAARSARPRSCLPPKAPGDRLALGGNLPAGRGPGRGGRAAMAAKADRVALRRCGVAWSCGAAAGDRGGDGRPLRAWPRGGRRRLVRRIHLAIGGAVRVIGDVAGSGLPTASAQAVRLPRPVPSFTRSRGNATCLAGRKWAARNSPGGSARTSTRLPDPAAKPALPAG